MTMGVDTVLVACGPVVKSIEQFFDGMLTRWPDLRIALDEREGGTFFAWRSDRRPLPLDSAYVLVARDRVMEATWDSKGYALDPSGEGPFAVAYQPCDQGTLKVRAMEDPYGRDRGGYGFQPYDVTVVGAHLYLISVVTPDEQSDFSNRVLVDLKGALRSTG